MWAAVWGARAQPGTLRLCNHSNCCPERSLSRTCCFQPDHRSESRPPLIYLFLDPFQVGSTIGRRQRGGHNSTLCLGRHHIGLWLFRNQSGCLGWPRISTAAVEVSGVLHGLHGRCFHLPKKVSSPNPLASATNEMSRIICTMTVDTARQVGRGLR